MANSLLFLDSLSFTIDSIKLATAESNYYQYLSGGGSHQVASSASNEGLQSSLAQQVAKAREQIQSSLKHQHKSSLTTKSGVNPEDEAMREENLLLKKSVEQLQNQVRQLTDRVSKLELAVGKPEPKPAAAINAGDSNNKKPQDDDDDVDLFGSDDENDEEAEKIRDQRLKEYAAKKDKKPGPIAKSSIILDVKPWSDETDMKLVEENVRTIVKDGLVWGASKLVPVGYGIKKLQIICVVEDDKVSIEELTENIEAFEEYVQSVDIAAFNKI